MVEKNISFVCTWLGLAGHLIFRSTALLFSVRPSLSHDICVRMLGDIQPFAFQFLQHYVIHNNWGFLGGGFGPPF